MLTVDIRTDDSTEESFRKLVKFTNLQVPSEQIAESMATVFISRIRRRFMKQENPDGSKWPMTQHAKIRMAGGFTYASGGRYAPGGKKTGGNILFSSGNLFHSIQLRGSGDRYSIRSDVSYAAKWQETPGYTIIGTSDGEVDLIVQSAINRIF